MSYDINWNSNHPGHVVYLVDLSGSMSRERDGVRMIDTVMSVLNHLFKHLSVNVISGNKVLEYFTITVIGYNDDVVTLFNGKSAAEFVTLMRDAKKRGYLFDTSTGGVAEPNWRTFMADAFNEAYADINRWIDSQKAKGISRIPAPLVINITDGEPFEGRDVDAVGKALAAANRLKGISTADGNTLLFNIHYTPEKSDRHLVLPSSAPADPISKFLFEASSVVPQSLVKSAQVSWPGCGVNAASRTMISNEDDPFGILRFITWGTSTGGAVDVDNVTVLEGIERPKNR